MPITVVAKAPRPARVFEYYRSTDGEWRYRVRATPNGKITMTGAEGYDSRTNVLRAIRTESKHFAGLTPFPIVEVNPVSGQPIKG